MEEKMYKAKINIGGYEAGEKVPEDKAKLWAEMYVESPVEKVDDNAEAEDVETESKEEVEAEPVNAMHDDYLNRNADVVIKAVGDDKLDKKTLKSLLKIESIEKKRKPVIEAIKLKLKSLN